MLARECGEALPLSTSLLMFQSHSLRPDLVSRRRTPHAHTLPLSSCHNVQHPSTAITTSPTPSRFPDRLGWARRGLVLVAQETARTRHVWLIAATKNLNGHGKAGLSDSSSASPGLGL